MAEESKYSRVPSFDYWVVDKERTLNEKMAEAEMH